MEDGGEQGSGGGEEDEGEQETESDTLGVTTVLDLSGLRVRLSPQCVHYSLL